MDLKAIQAKLKVLRDRIRDQGSISSSDEKELQSLINQTLTRTNTELEDIQSRLENITRKANDNRMLKDLDDDTLEMIRQHLIKEVRAVGRDLHWIDGIIKLKSIEREDQQPSNPIVEVRS